MAIATGCGLAHDLVLIAVCRVLTGQFGPFKLLLEQSLKGVPLGWVQETIAIPVNGLFLEGCPPGQLDGYLDPAPIQIPVAGHTLQRGEVLALGGQRFMRHVGMAGSAVLFFLRGMNLMAIFADQAFGLMDADRVPVGRPFMTGSACRAFKLLIVRDGFDVAVAARTGELSVESLFLESLMAAETIFRRHRPLYRGTPKNEGE
jgi:hypothetical protein